MDGTPILPIHFLQTTQLPGHRNPRARFWTGRLVFASHRPVLATDLMGMVESCDPFDAYEGMVGSLLAYS
jgi:hypothetical protein